jgi:hypothetical protein
MMVTVNVKMPDGSTRPMTVPSTSTNATTNTDTTTHAPTPVATVAQLQADLNDAHGHGVKDPAKIRAKMLDHYGPAAQAMIDQVVPPPPAFTEHPAAPSTQAELVAHGAGGAPVPVAPPPKQAVTPDVWMTNYMRQHVGTPMLLNPAVAARELQHAYPQLSPTQALTIAANAQRTAAAGH